MLAGTCCLYLGKKFLGWHLKVLVLLCNHLHVPVYSLGPVFMDQGFLLICGNVISWMRFPVSVTKISLFKFVFIEDVNLWGRATPKIEPL